LPAGGAGNCAFPAVEPESAAVKSRKSARPRKRPAAERPVASATLPAGELTGLLDDVKATVLALMASLAAKETDLRRQLGSRPTAGVRTGLSDIRLLRHWADRTLRTVQLLDRGHQQGGLRALLAELDEFGDIIHAHDAEQADEPGESS
jgi:hypothetical protein